MIKRTIRNLLLFVMATASTGCTALFQGSFRSIETAPSGLPWGEELVRRSLVLGTHDQALAYTQKGAEGAPSDALLAALFRGQAAFHAGKWQESIDAFTQADELTSQRYTKSISRGALALVINDNSLNYYPSRTEQLFSFYYSMLARLNNDDLEGAVVDARRLSSLLQEFSSELDNDERLTHAVLRLAAAAVFERGREWNDATVAMRNAHSLLGTSVDQIDSQLYSAPAGDSATLILIEERGFVAHPVAHRLALPLSGKSVEAKVKKRPDASEWLNALDAMPNGGVFLASERRRSVRLLNNGYVGSWVEIAWSSLARSKLPSARLDLSISHGKTPQCEEDVCDTSTLAAITGGTVSAFLNDALGVEARRARPAKLARLAARTITRAAAVEAVREEHGDVAGLITGLFASSLEQADTRSWHLLPGSITISRFTVPSGQVDPSLSLIAGSNPLKLPISSFKAEPGSTHIRYVRVWRDPIHSAPMPSEITVSR